jgi:TetR/AcrR family transcriptional regulator, transcriptional repressor for nem operon
MPTSTPGTKKERTRERIVQTAARALRRVGFDGVGVAEVMKEAGLTHGGFYAHFPSREALLVEALDAAAAESLASLQASGEVAEGNGERLAALIERYLSDEHADQPEMGCTLATLGTETCRQSSAVRAVATRRLTQFLKLLEAQLPGTAAERRERAQVLIATLVGSMLLSRLVADVALGRSFRKAARRLLRAALARAS